VIQGVTKAVFETFLHNTRFLVLMVLNVEILVFWNMTPFSLVVTNVPKERAAFTIYSEDV
jgi:hypothetical protein